MIYTAYMELNIAIEYMTNLIVQNLLYFIVYKYSNLKFMHIYNPYYTTGYSNDLAYENTNATIQMENQFYSETKNEVRLFSYVSFERNFLKFCHHCYLSYVVM